MLWKKKTTIEAKQVNYVPDKPNSHPHQSSTNAGTSISSTHFVCNHWISRISVKRLKYLLCQFYVPAAIIKLALNNGLHILPPRLVTFSEEIIRGGAFVSLHPFIVEVLDYFNVVPFKFTLNSIRTMVAFYIAFMEADTGESSAVEFAYVCCIKALARNERF